MAENLTTDPKDPVVVKPTAWETARDMLHEGRYFLAGFVMLLVICATLLALFGDRGALVTLRETDFACSQPAATNRYRFDKVETCNQYTRKVPTWIK